MTDTKLYVPAVALSTQDNTKLLEQLRCGFKRTINWNKYPSNFSQEQQTQHFDFFIYSIFQWVNRLFLLLSGNKNQEQVTTILSSD